MQTTSPSEEEIIVSVDPGSHLHVVPGNQQVQPADGALQAIIVLPLSLAGGIVDVGELVHSVLIQGLKEIGLRLSPLPRSVIGTIRHLIELLIGR